MNLAKIAKPFLRYSGIFFTCIICYLVLLILTNLIPFSWISNNLQKTSETLINEDEKEVFFFPYKFEVLFYYSDALIFNLIASVDSSSPFESALLSRKSYIPEQNPTQHTEPTTSLHANEQYLEPDLNCLIREFYGMMHGDTLTESWEYARYWHGHQVLLRPLLLIFDLDGIRNCILFVMLFLFFTFFYLATKKLGILTAISFSIALFSASFFLLPHSVNESLLFLFILGCMIFLLIRYRPEKSFAPFFFVIGSIINFFDLLTSPILGCLLPLLILLLLQIKDGKDGKELFKIFVQSGFLWILGYGLTWVMKWILVDIFFQRGIMQQAIEQILLRSDTSSITFYKVLQRVYMLLSPYVISATSVLAVLLAICRVIYQKIKNISSTGTLKKSISFWIIALIPFLWCYLIRNHAFFHPFFTYRLFILTILSVYLLILLYTGYFTSSPKQLPKKKSN